eukprot:IDg2054t1
MQHFRVKRSRCRFCDPSGKQAKPLRPASMHMSNTVVAASATHEKRGLARGYDCFLCFASAQRCRSAMQAMCAAQAVCAGRGAEMTKAHDVCTQRERGQIFVNTCCICYTVVY